MQVRNLFILQCQLIQITIGGCVIRVVPDIYLYVNPPGFQSIDLIHKLIPFRNLHIGRYYDDPFITLIEQCENPGRNFRRFEQFHSRFIFLLINLIINYLGLVFQSPTLGLLEHSIACGQELSSLGPCPQQQSTGADSEHQL